jgi:hypothetical protein
LIFKFSFKLPLSSFIGIIDTIFIIFVVWTLSKGSRAY